MAYFGVKVPKAYGISQPVLHGLARRIGKSHELAEQLWSSGNHEARILATLIGEPDKVTARQMERWAREFDSWDIVDAACCYLYAGASRAWRHAESWSRRREEFVKRAAFSLVAYLSYKDKQAPDARFERFLHVIEREAHDERNFVRKAVNCALRNAFGDSGLARRDGLPQTRCASSRATRCGGGYGGRRREMVASVANAFASEKVKIRRARRSDAERIAQLSG